MIDYREINHVMNNTPKNVNFLIDVAHLKVSSQVSGFDKYKVLEKCDKWIKAYHISDNDGEEDTNGEEDRDANSKQTIEDLEDDEVEEEVIKRTNKN